MWKRYPDEIPPPEEDLFSYTWSVKVLTFGKEGFRLARCEVWKPDEFCDPLPDPKWRLDGPDGWEVEGVTHWMIPTRPGGDSQ